MTFEQHHSVGRERRLIPRRSSAMLLSAIGVACMLVMASHPVLAATQAPAVKAAKPTAKAAQGLVAITNVEGVSEYRLPNGLQVLLVPDHAKPTTLVNMTYRVGSRYESYGETGMAHLLEHLLFKGSPRHPQVWAEFSKRGLSANGSTSFDRTNYFASFAANDDNLRWYLQWQADAMVNSFIARKDLDSEMTVVRNEMEMGENSPGRILFEKTLASMYQWHNYGKSTIGARTDVEGVDITRLQAFYKKYYQPDNATLIITGKFDQAKVLAWVREFFGPLPRPKAGPTPMYTLDPVQDGERSVTLRRVGGVPLLYAGYHIAPAAAPDYAAVELINLILGDTPSGRLHKQLTEKQLAASVFAFSEGLADPGFMILGAQLGPGQEMARARDALTKAVESLGSEPITADELERARAKWLKSWGMAFADPQQVGAGLSEAVAQGDWRLFFLIRDRIKALSLADVQRVASQVLVSSNRTLGEYIPTATPVRAPVPARVDVAAQFKNFKPSDQVAQVEAFDASPANIDARTQRFSLAPGLKVAFLPKASRGQAVKAVLNLRFGTEASLKGWGEAPTALAELLDKGGAGLSRQQVQDRLDALQSEVSFSGGDGLLTVSIDSRREHLPAVIRLVGQLLRQPALPPDVLEELRRQALSMVASQRKEPGAVVANALARHDNPYPPGDVRYARTFDEIEADWTSLSIERVKAYHDKFLSASHAEFAAVGDFDAAALRAALTAAFEGWRSDEPYARVPDPLLPVSPTRLVLPTPDKQNATLTVTQPVPLSDRDADYPALTLANYLLGSGGDSRLWNRIREKEGLSYSVYSHVDWNVMEPHSTWAATAIFAPQNLAKVEKALQEEVRKALTEGFTQAELEAGRKGLLNYRRLSRAQDDRLASAWANNLYVGRTFAESARVDEALEALTLEQVNAALRRYVKPEQFVTGVGGDFKETPRP
jgi:zinc protease